MISYDINNFSIAFKRMGITYSDILIIHSSFTSFGKPTNESLSDVPKQIFSQLIDVIGEEGTIVVPAFNFDFCNGILFNRQTSPSKLMGVFSSYILGRTDSIRSYHPMQSVAAIGRKAKEISLKDSFSAFDDNGSWAELEKLNAKILLLGTNFNSASIVHMVEQRENVPYRYWKSFSGQYIDNGVETTRTYRMFVRNLDQNPVMDYSSLENLLESEKLICKEKIGKGQIISCYCKDVVKYTQDKIRNNPYYFVSNHPDFLLTKNGIN
jgi:aminoglycoside N3'-acetyltransferase